MKAIGILWKSLMMVRQSDRRAFWLKVLYVVLGSLLPLANLWVLKLLIDEATSLMSMAATQTTSAFWVGLGGYSLLFCGIFLLNRLVSSLNGVNSDVLSQKLIDYISDRLQRKSASLDMAYYDNPAYHDTFHRAQQEATYRPINIMENAMSLFGSLLSIAGVMAMLVTASWWVIVVMVFAVVPSLLVRLAKARSIYAFRREHTQDYRRTSYYSALLTHRDFAKEVRVYGLAPYFRERFVRLRQQLVSQLLRISRRIAVMDSFCSVVETVALLFILMLLLTKCVGGALTIGSFVMLFEAFRRGQGYLHSLVGAVSGLYDSRLFVSNLFEFLDLQPVIVNPKLPVAFPDRVDSIEFRDITFRYPDMEKDVLNHFSLKAERGTITRIEGENGFGKSTLVKLLLRLYDPIQGKILINGIDIRNFRLEELRKGVGVIFQDYVRYYCTLKENIVFGDISSMVDEGRLHQAMEQAGLDAIVEKLPQGLDTPLGRMFDNGAELSMGQWQRVALARQLYSSAPMLIFDEPTAWMDLPSRERFYSMLDQLKDEHLILMIAHV